MPKTICKICDNTEFENINGRYYCTVCSSQHHGVVDIEFSDEETDHKGTHQLNKAAASASKNQAAKIEEEENERNVDANYSTYHVFNHLLRAQANDLVKLGVNPLVKKIIFEIWSKYLGRLKVAFCRNHLEQRKNTVKWLRDKRYFEIYELKLEHEMQQVQKMETEDLSADANFLADENQLRPEPEAMEPEVEKSEQVLDQANEPDSENNTGSPQESADEERDESEAVADDKRKRANLLLTKFEWIRMPHTVAILNLALLVLKSPILITDLVRLIYDGKISYFNIENVLPESMHFTLDRDSLMFNVTSLPKCEYLRYLTAKLGQYLSLASIQIVPLEQVTARFVVDLNLPRDLNAVIRMLMQKILPATRLNFGKAESVNIEEMALSYVYLAQVILFEYDANSLPLQNTVDDLFRMEEWIKEMQSTVFSAERRIIGSNIDELKTMKDLDELKISSFQHRHKMNTKPYISKYRRALVHKTLQAPLDTYGLDPKAQPVEKSDQDAQPSLYSHLFYLNQVNVESCSKQFAFQRIDDYLTADKLRLLTARDARLSSKKFADFIDEYFSPGKNEGVGRYAIGLETNTCYWLLDMFHQLSQTRSLFKIYKRVCKMIDRL